MPVEGTFTWKDGTIQPAVADSETTAYTVVFTPEELDKYAVMETSITLTFNKAGAVAATVTANNRTYDATEKPLVTVEGEPTGGEMRYALGNNATTAPADTLFTTSIPAGTSVGTYYVWYKVVGDENHNDFAATCVPVTITARQPYVITSAQGTEHVLGNNADAVITVTDPVDDSQTYEKFTGVAVGGNSVPGDSFTKAKGSLILTLKAGYLNSLSAGEHKVTISFTDGSVETTLKILAPAPTTKPLPKTGDSNTPALWLGLILVGLIACGVTLILSGRKRG